MYKLRLGLQLLLLTCLNLIATSIVLEINYSPLTKCFRAQHSPGKTLEVRLGLIRRQYLLCRLYFTVNIMHPDGYQIDNIYSSEFFCQQINPSQPFVLKHSNQHTQQSSYYQICLNVFENQNPNPMILLSIGQRLSPQLIDDYSSMPLVQSQQMLQMQASAQVIKRSLFKSQQHAKQIRVKGDRLDAKIEEMMFLNRWVTVLQILILIMFGVMWVKMVMRIKK